MSKLPRFDYADRTMRKLVTVAAFALVVAGFASAAAHAPGPLLPFYPQAGILGQDVFVTNHVDTDPGPGVLDYDCGRNSYDGHTGQDSVIRSFREQKIGVPVFAALDGRVLSSQLGEGGDFSWGSVVTRFDNHIVLQHADETTTVYGHLARRSIKVKKGQWVPAGAQIGLTASSGNSTWPHLHFTVRREFVPYEPFAGQCRAGESGWASQPRVDRSAYVGDVALSAKPFTGRLDLPYDEAVRTGAFVRGVRDVHLRIEVRNWRGGSGTITVRRPDGQTASSVPAPAPSSRAGWLKQRLRLDLAMLGRWTITYAVDGTVLAEAPFQVVASARAVVNRPPAPVAVTLDPPAPRAGEVVVCKVSTSLVAEDPDYEIVRYRYRWTSGGRLIRQLTSAALSDAIPNNAARPGEALRCEVTPSDGKLRAPTASVAATLPA